MSHRKQLHNIENIVFFFTGVWGFTGSWGFTYRIILFRVALNETVNLSRSVTRVTVGTLRVIRA